MIIVPPQAIVPATLLSTNVVETAPALYNAATTYAAGATVSVAETGNALGVYTSLQAANVNHTPASSPTWWKRTGTTYGLWSAAVTYAKGDIILDAVNHFIYESQQAGNLNKAITDNAWWLQVRASNTWAMFDQSNSSQTTNPEEIIITLQADGLVESIGFTNIDASSIRVQMIDPVEGIVWDETRDLISDSGIDDFWPWFFSEPVRKSDTLFKEMVPYADAQIKAYIYNPGGIAKCGNCVIGQSRAIGGTQWGAQVGNRDYSSVVQNEWGDYEITRRGHSKRGEFVVWVDNDWIDELQRVTAEYRSMPLLFEGDSRWGATLIFGILLDGNIEIPGPDKSLFSMQIGGLP